MTQRLFVYGVLMSTARREGGQDAVAHAVLATPCAYAAALRHPHGRLRGVVFEVSDTILAGYDHLEGTARGFYNRVEVALDDGTVAWMYEAGNVLGHGGYGEWDGVRGYDAVDSARLYNKWTRGRKVIDIRLPDELDEDDAAAELEYHLTGKHPDDEEEDGI